MARDAARERASATIPGAVFRALPRSSSIRASTAERRIFSPNCAMEDAPRQRKASVVRTAFMPSAASTAPARICS